MTRLGRAGLVTAILLAGLVAVLYLAPGPAPKSHVYFEAAPERRAEIIAHGGGQGHAPPNTLLALETALALGADVLEVDVQQTRDGVLVLRHDDTMDRTTNMSGPIADLTWEQVRGADAGATWVLDGRSFADQGIGVPRLDAALAAFPDARWVVEIKNDTPSAARAMCETLRAADATERVLVGSFHDRAMHQFRTACPEVATSMSRSEAERFVLAAKIGLSRRIKTPAMALQIPREAAGLALDTPRVIAAAKARGIRIQYWTINDLTTLRTLAARGADGLITDRVDRGRRAVGLDPVHLSRTTAPSQHPANQP